MREKRELSRLARRYSKKLKSLDMDVSRKTELARDIIDYLDATLTKEEKADLVLLFFKEISFKSVVERPEFMIKQSNVILRTVLFTSLAVTFLLFTTALLFSNSPFIVSIQTFVNHLIEIFTIK